MAHITMQFEITAPVGFMRHLPYVDHLADGYFISIQHLRTTALPLSNRLLLPWHPSDCQSTTRLRPPFN